MKSLNSSIITIAVAMAPVSIGFAQTSDQRVVVATTSKVARIPADSNLASIKFQGVKAVTLTNTGTVTDGRCAIAERGEPGGSMFCAPSAARTHEQVYQVTYSYEGLPLVSDEYGTTHSTFSVYFRPEELTGAERRLISVGKHGRTETASMFEWTTSREVEARVVVDNTNSTMCTRTYVDGTWTQKDPECQDNAIFKTISVPSDYVAVRVTLARGATTIAAE